ncbi:lipoprotein [Oceanobacillus sp. FSL K6-2867]|uniref:lipoprotein n=1 Tax=Oceanobacillus sp. FSL K6-2867 TaxID=2954748 RepID=UPI0030DC2A75
MNKLLFLISILLLLAGCHYKEDVINAISFNPSEYRVMILPAESVEEIDDKYVDAIIDIKAKYPTEFSDAKKVEIDPAEMDIPLESNDTTLIIQKNGQTIAQLSSNMTKNEIIEQLEFTLEDGTKAQAPG